MWDEQRQRNRIPLTRLSLEDLQAVRDWLDDFIEDQLEVGDEFKAKIQRAKQEIAQGVYSRTRKLTPASDAALQIYSRDFDADFFKLPSAIQARIESNIDRLE